MKCCDICQTHHHVEIVKHVKHFGSRSPCRIGAESRGGHALWVVPLDGPFGGRIPLVGHLKFGCRPAMGRLETWAAESGDTDAGEFLRWL